MTNALNVHYSFFVINPLKSRPLHGVKFIEHFRIRFRYLPTVFKTGGKISCSCRNINLKYPTDDIVNGRKMRNVENWFNKMDGRLTGKKRNYKDIFDEKKNKHLV